VRDVVRLADVNLAAVNYYFGGKEGLYAATIADLTSTRAILRPRDDFEKDPVGLLHTHVSVLLRRSMEGGRNAKLSRILAHESMEPTPYFENMIASAIGPEFERLIQLVERVAGKPLERSDAASLALSVMGQCYFYLFAAPAVRALLQGPPDPVESLAAKITDYSVDAIRSFANRKQVLAE